MDFHDAEYYNVIKILLSVVGIWRTQSETQKNLLKSIVFFFLLSFQVTQISKCITTSLDIDTAMKIIGPEIIALISLVTYIFLLLHYRKIHALLQHMRYDWKNLNVKEEINILRHYTLEGKRIIIFFTMYEYCSICLFIFALFIPHIINAFLPLNETRCYEHPYVAEYFVDEQKYFYSILFHMIGCILVGHAVVIANDCLYITYIQHVCGMIKILGCHLQNICNISNHDIKKDHKMYLRVVRSVQIHRRILRFVEKINICFGWIWFIKIVLGFLVISAALMQIATQLNQRRKAAMYANFAVGSLAYFLFIMHPGQKLMNHSEELMGKVYQTEWYSASVNIRRLILIIMRRCKYSLALNAGKFYNLSFETFGAIIHLSLSYFTMLYSLDYA
ncbi:odorant receptor 13a-like [Prorops nasuta]|uniref:odorant receptor 13a-like n=1 Tax=Prorops nasuta TaxID=863751 RepID=UPI0034CFDE85